MNDNPKRYIVVLRENPHASGVNGAAYYYVRQFSARTLVIS